MSLREFQKKKCFFNLTKPSEILKRIQNLGPWNFTHKPPYWPSDVSLSDKLILLSKGIFFIFYRELMNVFMGAVALKWVKMAYFFNGKKLSLGSGWSHVKRLWACEHGNPPPQKNWGNAFIIVIHSFTLSKLWGCFSKLSAFPKIGLLKIIELSQFLCYKDDAQIKI